MVDWARSRRALSRTAFALAATMVVSLCATACASNPARREVALAWYELGNAWFDKSEWKKAGEAYSRALALDRSLSAASYNFARALAEAGDYPAALDILDDLAKRDPGNVRVISAKAYALYKSGDAAAARLAYDELVALDPYSVDAIYNSALLKAAAGDKEEAADDLGRLVATKNDDTAALLLLGRLNAELGKRDEAIKAYETARGPRQGRRGGPRAARPAL